MNLDEVFGDFEFKMGDVVEHSTLPGMRLSVLSQLLERWPGGIAKVYVCRTVATEDRIIDRFYEHELQPFSGRSG